VVTSVSVFLSVCLCVCPSHNLKTARPNFIKFLYMLPMAAARSSPGGVALCTSSFVDEVILLLYNGSMACRVYFNTESITVEIPIKFYHFAPEGKQSIATSPSVCMSVCPHAYLKIHKTELHQIFRACSLRCSWLGSPLTTLCISGFVYEVILSRNRQVIHAFSSN